MADIGSLLTGPSGRVEARVIRERDPSLATAPNSRFVPSAGITATAQRFRGTAQ